MRVKCKNCLPKEGIDLPEFSLADKRLLTETKIESPVKVINLLMVNYKLPMLESKYITLHINEKYGECNRCKYDAMDQENMTCPKCKALNLNWKV